MHAWIAWLVGACLLGLGEMHQGGFYLAPFAAGAALAAIVSGLGVAAGLSVAVFVGASAIVFATLRPVAARQRRLPPAIRTGAAALIGRKAVVLERISNLESVGCVRIDGEVWTARSFDEQEVFDQGEQVEVVEIRGATALVMR